MAHYQKKRTGSRGKGKGLILIAVLVVIILAAAVFAWTHSGGDGQPQELPQETPQETPQGDQAEAPGEDNSAAVLTFPCTLAEGGLEISALFSSNLMNPDGGNAPVEQLASLEVANTSGRYLVSAAFTVTLTDGTDLPFLVRDLPAGEKTIAFTTDNAAYDGTPCKAIRAETEFADGGQLMEGSVSFTVDGTTVTLTNLTGEDLEPLTVTCRDTLDETEYFGGSSYAYRTAPIPAGESVTVEAVDCIIGLPAVVRITGGG